MASQRDSRFTREVGSGPDYFVAVHGESMDRLRVATGTVVVSKTLWKQKDKDSVR